MPTEYEVAKEGDAVHKNVVLDVIFQGVHQGYLVFCPACKCGHLFDKRWTFNGDFMKPTFRASMLVFQDVPEKRCHSFVTDGNIEFLGDCGHAMKGQTVPLQAIY